MNKSLLKQFGKPSGILGSIAGKVMLLRNKERINWVVSLLDAKPTDNILEIGYGPGSSIKTLGEKINGGKITGIDHSEVMYKSAGKKNSSLIKAGKVELLWGTIETVKPPSLFDKIFAINVSIFWKNPVDELIKIKHMLKSGGKLFIAVQPRFTNSSEELKKIATTTEKQIFNAGFRLETTEYNFIKPVGVFCIIAAK